MNSETPPIKIGEILTQCGLVSPAQLELALEHGRERHIRLGEALVQLGILDEDRLTWALGLQFDLSYVDVQADMIDWSLMQELPLARLYELRVVPLSRLDGMVTVVTSDPARRGLASFIAELFPLDRVTIQITSEDAIFHVLNEAERRTGQAPEYDPSQTTGTSAWPEQLLQVLESARGERLFVLRTPDSRYGRIFGDARSFGLSNTFSPAAMQRLFAMIADNFVQTQSFAGGGYYVRAADDEAGTPALRAVALTGFAGEMVAIARVPEELPSSDAAQTYVVETNAPAAAKTDLLRAASEGATGARPVISIESRVDCFVRSAFQTEIPDGAQRILLCAHLLEMVRPRAMIVEVDSVEDIARFPSFASAGNIFIIARAPAAEATLPAHMRRLGGGDLHRQIENILAEES